MSLPGFDKVSAKTGVVQLDEEGNPALGEDGKEIKESVESTVSVNFGASLEEAVEIYGKDAVETLYSRGLTLAVQSKQRQELTQGTDPAVIQGVIDNFDPVGKGTHRDPEAAAFAALSRIPEEERAAKLQELAQRFGLA